MTAGPYGRAHPISWHDASRNSTDHRTHHQALSVTRVSRVHAVLRGRGSWVEALTDGPVRYSGVAEAVRIAASLDMEA